MKDAAYSGFIYGHPIHIERDEYVIEDGTRSYSAWRFSETDKLIDDIDKIDLVCPKCGMSSRDTDGDDPCIANLPGVRAACCGHGVEDAYILFDDGREVRGTAEVEQVVETLRGNK